MTPSFMGYKSLIGVAGVFEVSDSYQQYVAGNVKYTIVGDDLIETLEANGHNILARVYTDRGREKDDYVNDKEKNINILTLKDDAGNLKFIPAKDINNMPETEGVWYKSVALAVKLGPHQSDTNFDPLINDIKEMILTRYGVVIPDIEIIDTSREELVPMNKHDEIVIVRTTAITDSDGYKEKYDRLKPLYDSLLLKVESYQCYIIEKNNIP